MGASQVSAVHNGESLQASGAAIEALVSDDLCREQAGLPARLWLGRAFAYRAVQAHSHAHTHVLLPTWLQGLLHGLLHNPACPALQQSSTAAFIHWPSCPGGGTGASLLQTASSARL